MIVQIIDIGDLAFLEAEDHSPVRPHRYRPEAGIFAFEPVEPEAGQVHIIGRSRSVQARQDVSHRLAVVGSDAALVATFEEPFQRSAFETPDHIQM